jgi:hypothetical protein
VVPGETHERGEASRPGETLGVTETRDLPADVPKEKATNDVDRLARKLGDAFVATAVARGRAYERLLAKVEALARDVERAHRVSLESAAKAHEKAYNQLRAPTKRLERLRARDQELDDDDAVALKIDQAEVDLGKRVGIMKETTSMLKQRSAAFLADWTPAVANAFRGLNFAQRDATHADAQAFGEGCLVHDDCDGSTEAARRACREYLVAELPGSIKSEEDESSVCEGTVLEGRVAPHTTPLPSSADIAARAEGKAKARAPAA